MQCNSASIRYPLTFCICVRVINRTRRAIYRCNQVSIKIAICFVHILCVYNEENMYINYKYFNWSNRKKLIEDNKNLNLTLINVFISPLSSEDWILNRLLGSCEFIFQTVYVNDTLQHEHSRNLRLISIEYWPIETIIYRDNLSLIRYRDSHENWNACWSNVAERNISYLFKSSMNVILIGTVQIITLISILILLHLYNRILVL